MAGQQLAAASTMGDWSVLPPELLLMICELLLPQHDRSFDRKHDLVTVSRFNRTLNATANKVLVRDVTITFTLRDELPAVLQRWQPQAWEIPAVMRLLQGSGDLRSYVRSLQLRLCPFPVHEWTTERFNSIKARLKANTEAWGDTERRRSFFNVRDFNNSSPRSVQARQEFIVDAYTALFLWRCGWPDTTPWTRDLEPLLQQLLAQLPNLEHIETADMGFSPRLGPAHPMPQWSLSYADALVLRTAPRAVRSICFRSWPVSPISIDVDDEDNHVASHASDARRLQDFVRNGAQFMELTIDSHMPVLMTGMGIASDTVLDIWRQGLLQLRNLTTLTLLQPPCNIVYSGAGELARQGKLDPKLDHLFNEALILENVKTLTLVHWLVPATLFVDRLRKALPALKKLYLQGVAILSEKQRQGEQLWLQCADALQQDGKVSVAVSEPKVCVKWKRYSRHEVVTMRKQARLALEGRLGQ